MRRTSFQFIKYCFVGASGVVVNMVVYSLLVSVAHMHYLAGATISFTVAVTSNFLLNKYWTFNNPQGRVFTQAFRFLVISLASLLVNLLILRLLIDDLGIANEIEAQMIAIAAVTILNFAGNKLWSFRQSSV
jgi:putative flippase GtrA